ncbi:hypothetical protein GC163_20990 [bacterium]|nr:hypothetical protein [bacterium]
MPIRCFLAVGLTCAVIGNVTVAQELRIYTVTRDQTHVGSDPSVKATIMARSLTLFHAGKVYDYIDSLQEVTIFEPAHHRFTVLNDAAGHYAIISQDQVRRYLALAEDHAREVSGELVRNGQADDRLAIELLQFQLRPQFETKYDAATRHMSLHSPHYAYEVQTAAAPQAALLDAYLNYADALVELNAVLHPQSFLPGPRLVLNRSLRQEGVLPISVKRRADFGHRSELVAEHEWKWSLTELDRQLIETWESKIFKGIVKELPFEQMQRAVLTGRVSQR